MKCKGKRTIKEVPLINLLKPENLRKLNIRFNRNWQPQRVESFARIIEQIRHDEIDRLMREKPKGGGYGL